MQVSVVIPCYNEAENIPLILERFSKAIGEREIAVVLVDNGSSDGSAEILASLLPGYPFARSVRVQVNQGYGYGILAGLREADSPYVGWTHADMQTDPADIARAYDTLAADGFPADVYIKGKRKGRPLFDVFFTAGMSCFETILTGRVLRDINAQPNLFPRAFFETWKNPPHDFALDLYALYMAKGNGLRIVRFPVLFPERIHGQSKWNTGFASKWKFIKRTMAFSFQLKKGGIE